MFVEGNRYDQILILVPSAISLYRQLIGVLLPSVFLLIVAFPLPSVLQTEAFRFGYVSPHVLNQRFVASSFVLMLLLDL